MKNLDIKHLKEVISTINWDKIYSPYKFLLLCGWDKDTYDEYAIKNKAGTLDGADKQAFDIIYLRIQMILANLEEQTIQGKMFPQTLYQMQRAYNPIAFAVGKTKTTIEENVDKYKRVQEHQNTSPINLLEDDTTNI